MNAAAWPIGLITRALLIAPIVLVALAMVPALALYPILPDRAGQRVITVLRQVRAWHSDAMERLALT